MAENSAVAVVAGTVAATDADVGINANLIYSVQYAVTGSASHWALDAATGVVATAVTTLDRETLDTYLLRVRVTDQGTPQLFAEVQYNNNNNTNNNNNNSKYKIPRRRS